MIPAKTICLCMIVRNEAHVIRRALESARPLVDAWVICDTGSTDRTPEVIAEAMAGIPGELHHVPWVDFGHNRTEVLRLARGRADYLLVIDADMVVNVARPFCRHLTADAYEVRYEGEMDYSQRMLVSAAHEWTYVGVTHEYIHSPTMRTVGDARGLTLTHLGDGGNRAEKFSRDVRLLTAALADDPGNARSIFYLAQSLRDLGDPAAALEWYEKRAAMEGTWEEERWFAGFQAARMRLLLGEPWEAVVLPALMAAFTGRPGRLEPLYEVVRTLRERGEHAQGYAFSAFAGHGPVAYPAEDRLFIDRAVYDHLLLLEYGVCACGTGRVSEAVAAFNRVLRCETLPAWVADAARQGRALALDLMHPPVSTPAPARRNRIVVVSGFRDAGDLLAGSVESVLGQDHPDFRVLYVDDASADGCARHVPRGDPRVRLLRRREAVGLAANLRHVVTRLCDPDDIVVVVDGDDRLARPDALSRVAEAYARWDCWVTCGQFRYVDGAMGFCEPFAAPRDVGLHRLQWRASHLKTFRAGLFHAIALQDPAWECLRDGAGRWLTSAVDVAVMTPLVEMAGFGRVRFIDEVLYEYNHQNPRSHHNVDRAAQWASLQTVQAKRPFAPLAALPQSPVAARRAPRRTGTLEAV